ncbi:MAG: methionyl-tRNA formyltransferase [Candidatus Omnitrophica bacterium]|nr:methionyl-tRNA formyltransferase [Candidatus Omnitrophota bacterium]
MRIVFFGSDDFAAVCLKELLQSSHTVVGCVTGPDKRQGRGMQLALSPIKEIALAHEISCLQPESLKLDSIQEQLKVFAADIFVVVAYGRLLPQAVLDIPKFFCINIHGSLLPQYRGAAPVNWAIINGDRQTGVTIQKMIFELDAGDVISQEVMPLSEGITSEELRLQMAEVGAKLLVKTLDAIASNRYTCTPQDKSKISYATKLTKELGHIAWDKSATEIERLIRGLKPWPGTFTHFKGKGLKILEATVVPIQGSAGTVLDISKEGFVVACAQDALLVKRVHLEASKPVSAYDFVQGHRLAVGDQLN